MNYSSQANAITYSYYCILRASTRTAHLAVKIMRNNGAHTYPTYYLVTY